jgi:hypothetical protein
MLVMIKTTPPLPRLGVVAVLGIGNTIRPQPGRSRPLLSRRFRAKHYDRSEDAQVAGANQPYASCRSF